MKRIANCAVLTALMCLAWRVAALEDRERYLLRALRLTERNVEKLASLERFFFLHLKEATR